MEDHSGARLASCTPEELHKLLEMRVADLGERVERWRGFPEKVYSCKVRRVVEVLNAMLTLGQSGANYEAIATIELQPKYPEK